MKIREVRSQKQIHGWWNGLEPYGARECTSERLLINPYNGCSHDCFFCYSHAFPGYFEDFRKRKIITVFKDFDKSVAKQLDSIKVASCGYLSPVTDPFQPINDKYQLTERIMQEFIKRNIPVDVTTKNVISNRALSLLRSQQHSFAQTTILTPHEGLRRKLIQGGATNDELLRNMERLSNNDIFTVCRIDPIIPYVNHQKGDIEELVEKAVDAGAKHIIASCMDVPILLRSEIFDHIESEFGRETRRKCEGLYRERMSGRLHATIEYRRKLFRMIREVCDKREVTFALCMEFKHAGKQVKGLNREFMSSYNCEGIDVPIYVRHGVLFEPVDGCRGNCLRCYYDGNAKCGIDELRKAGAWKLGDYRRWSKLLASKTKQTTLEDVHYE